MAGSAYMGDGGPDAPIFWHEYRFGGAWLIGRHRSALGHYCGAADRRALPAMLDEAGLPSAKIHALAHALEHSK